MHDIVKSLGQKHYTKLIFLSLTLLITIPLLSYDNIEWSQRSDLTPTQMERLINSDLNFMILLRDQLLQAQQEIEGTDRLNGETKLQIAALLVGGALTGVPQLIHRKGIFKRIAVLVGASLVFTSIPLATKVSESMTDSVRDQYLLPYSGLMNLVKKQLTNSHYTQEQLAKLDQLQDLLLAAELRASDLNSYNQWADYFENVSVFISIISLGSAATGAMVPFLLSIPLNGVVNVAYVGLRTTGEIKQAHQHRKVIKDLISQINSMILSSKNHLATYAY